MLRQVHPERTEGLSLSGRGYDFKGLSPQRLAGDFKGLSPLTLSPSKGDVDGAIACLQEAYEEKSIIGSATLYGVTWDPVRDDPRFQAILKGMHLTN